MKALSFVLILLAGAAFAQPVVTRGGALKKRQYQTYSNLTLYVDPTGSDTGACTGTGTSACATLDGAFNKLPRFIRNNVTINVAAGTYPTFTIGAGLDVQQGATLEVLGVMSAATLATGATTGTVTSAVAGSSAGPPTVTDSGQSWTVNNLKGAFITYTSGALSGQSFPIYANTATILTVPHTATVPAAGTTYSINRPASVFTGTATNTITGLTGNGTFRLNQLDVVRTATSYALTATNNNPVVSLQSVSVRGPAGALAQGSRYSLTRVYVEASSSLGVTGLAPNSTTSSSSGIANIASSYIKSVAAAISLLAASVSPSSLISVIAEGGAGGSLVVSVNATNNVQMPSIWIYCLNPSSVGLGVNSITSSSAPATSTGTMNGGVRITGCATGVQLNGRSAWTFLAPAFDTCTTAFRVEKGASIDFVGATPTFTGVTNELNIDGTTYPFSFLSGLPTPQVISDSYGSTFIR